MGELMKELRIKLKNNDYKLDTKQLIILVMRQWLHRTNISGFVDMCVHHIPSPVENAKKKITKCYKGGPIYTTIDTEDDEEEEDFAASGKTVKKKKLKELISRNSMLVDSML